MVPTRVPSPGGAGGAGRVPGWIRSTGVPGVRALHRGREVGRADDRRRAHPLGHAVLELLLAWQRVLPPQRGHALRPGRRRGVQVRLREMREHHVGPVRGEQPADAAPAPGAR